MDRIQQLIHLIRDPDFIDLEHLQTEPSFFNVVGRTFTETWHSAILGWLLNPASSHGLGDYALQRFVMLMSQIANDNEITLSLSPDDLLIDADFTNVESQPNEFKPEERSIGVADKKGRFDVYIDNIRHIRKTITIIVEMKVNAVIDVAQNRKYLEWADMKQGTWGEYVLPVYVTPEWNYATEGYNDLYTSNRWIIMSFQQLYDDVFTKALANPKISNFGRAILEEYIKTLRQPNPEKGNRRMIITEKERELAQKIAEKYGDVIDVLLQTQRPEEFAEISNSASQKKATIRLSLKNGQVFTSRSIPELYAAVLKYLVDNRLIDRLEMPYSLGRTQYLLTTEDPPVHGSGRSFIRPVLVDGYKMEANWSRETGIEYLTRLLKKLDLEPLPVNQSG